MKDIKTTISFLLICVLALFLCKQVEGKTSYTGYRIVRACLTNQTQVTAVKNLNLDVWSAEGVLKIGCNDIRANDQNILQLYQSNVEIECLLFELQNEVDREAQELNIDQGGFGEETQDSWFDLYRTFDDLVTFLQGLASDYSLITTYSSIGTTYEGRDIPSVKITGTATGTKQKVVVIGGLHAREWISSAVPIYIAQELATLYGIDDTVTFFLDNFELHFIPLANPDGYVYTWTTSRLWRKNRKPTGGSNYGVDLNKNFNATRWASACTYPASSDTYCGANPFSEKETSAIRNYVLQNGPFCGALEYSSYGQQVLRPFGYTITPAPNDPVLKTIGDQWANVLGTENSVPHSSSPAISSFNSTGNARDWFYSYANIPLSYTVQVRDSGGYGFLLPNIQILPTAKENYAGFLYFLQSVRNYA